jgi:hypothetical protein
MSFTDNDYPVTSSAMQGVAWDPLGWVRNRLQGQPQQQQGPDPAALPRPGTIHDQRRQRQMMIDQITGGQ